MLDSLPPGLLVQAGFSWLFAGQEIAPHSGKWAGVLAYHLGIVVPDAADCLHRTRPQLRVGSHWRSWKRCGPLIFDDTLEHELHNACNGSRVVLWIRVRRPQIDSLMGMAVLRFFHPIYLWFVERRTKIDKFQYPLPLFGQNI